MEKIFSLAFSILAIIAVAFKEIEGAQLAMLWAIFWVVQIPKD